MSNVTILRVVAAIALVNGFSTLFTFHMVSDKDIAFAIAILGWLSFVSLPFIFPSIALLSGKITSRTSVTYRAIEPVRFWVGFITYEILIVFFAFLATLMFHGYLVTRP